MVKEKFDLIVVQDIEMLPLAIRLKKKNKSKVLFDAREFYPREFENDLKFRIFYSKFRTKLCKIFLPLCDQVITVSPGLAEGYVRDFNIHTTVIRSVPTYIPLPVNPVNSNKIKMVYHGAANKDRKLENMIDIFKFLDQRFTLDFYLCGGDESYKNYLINKAKKYFHLLGL